MGQWFIRHPDTPDLATFPVIHSTLSASATGKNCLPKGFWPQALLETAIWASLSIIFRFLLTSQIDTRQRKAAEKADFCRVISYFLFLLACKFSQNDVRLIRKESGGDFAFCVLSKKLNSENIVISFAHSSCVHIQCLYMPANTYLNYHVELWLSKYKHDTNWEQIDQHLTVLYFCTVDANHGQTETRTGQTPILFWIHPKGSFRCNDHRQSHTLLDL